MQTLIPTSNQLICERLEAERKTASGFFIPEQQVTRPQIARVLYVAKGVEGIEKNDQVVYKPYAAAEVKVHNKEYLIVDVQDVLAKVAV